MVRRVTPLLQTTQSECGLVACVMLMHTLGGGSSLSELREKYDIGRDGMSIRQIRQLLVNDGFATKVLRNEGEGYRQLHTPFIAYWQNAHYVVVESIHTKRIVIVDPAVGRRSMKSELFRKQFSNIAITAETTAGTVPLRTDPIRWNVLWPFIKSHPNRFVAMLLLSLASVVATIALPPISAQAIAPLLQTQTVPQMSALLAGTLLGFICISIGNTLVTVSAAIAVGRDLSKTTFWRLLCLPYSYFTNRARGDILFKLHSTQTTEQFLTGQLARGITSCLLSVCSAITLIVMSPTLGELVCLEFVIILISLIVVQKVIAQWSDSETQNESIANSVQVDAVSTISLLKTTGLTQTVYGKWEAPYERQLKWEKKRSYLDGAIQSIIGFLQSFSPLIFTVLAISNSVSVSTALSFQMLSSILFGQITVLAQLASQIGQTSASVRRLEDILAADVDETFDHGTIKIVGQDVRLTDISYSYDSLSKPVLQHVTMRAEAGKRIAIVGPSASGKSTIAKLIVGLTTPKTGQITFNGIPLAKHDEQAFRAQVSYVEQESPLLNATIRENIAWGRTGLSDESIIRAARMADIHKDIENMPMKYETLVTQNGNNLSGGQRQRIALARALLDNPKVIVLDEATSALDRVAERHVMNSLEQLSATRIVIAHRLETIRDSDSINVVSQGRVIATGQHEDLLARCSLYENMYRRETQHSLIKISAGTGLDHD